MAKRSARTRGKEAVRKTGISDEAVVKATGKTWKEWFDLLDEAGAVTQKHADIVKMLPHEVGDWWKQMVTVSYERARSLRSVHQKCSGEFAAAASKTFNVPLDVLFDAWNDAKSRAGWLREGVVVKRSTANKSIRMTVKSSDKPVDVNFYARGDGKTQVAVDHRQLESESEVQEAKASWKEAFERLQKKLATMG
jgi:hypothetical protein